MVKKLMRPHDGSISASRPALQGMYRCGPRGDQVPFFFANLFASVRELYSKVGDDLTVKGGVSW